MRAANRATTQPLSSFIFNPSLQKQSLLSSNPSPKPKRIQFFTSLSLFHTKPMSISSPFRLFSAEFPQPLLHHPHTPIFKPIKIQSLPLNPTKFSFFRPITIERLSKTPIFSSPSSSAVSLQPIEELPPKLQEIVNLFQAVDQPKAKYEQLLFYGTKLKPLDTQYKTSKNKVQGCVSQVWVRAYLDDNKNVIFEADSDSVLTKGLAALLVQGLSGRPVQEIVRVSPDFVVLLGLQQSLTPSRNNGFLNMLKLMQKKALQLYVEAEKANDSGENVSKNTVEESSLGVDESGNDDLSNAVSYEEGGNAQGLDSGNDGGLGSRGMRIKERLERELNPVELIIEDISYQHAGHAGVKGSDGETHFNVKIVSDEFEGKSMVKRHRLVYQLLQNELQSGLHALSIVAKTPSEVNT